MTKENKYAVGDLVEVVHDLHELSEGSIGVIYSLDYTYGLYISEEARRRTRYVLYEVIIDSKIYQLLGKDLRLLRKHSAG